MAMPHRSRQKSRLCCAGFLVVGVVLYLVAYLLIDDKITHDEDASLLTRDRRRVLDTVEARLPTADHLTARDAVWQSVATPEHKLLAFSAYLERRDATTRWVRVVGVTRTHWSAPVWCRLWYDAAPRKSVTVLAAIKIIRENWDLEHSACFFLCPLDDGDVATPDAVSLVRRLHDEPSNKLRVVDNFDATARGKLAVCVQPLHSITDAFRVIEFMEMYTVLGADHFTLYDNNTDPTVSCVLDAYVAQGRLTLLPWDLPLDGRLVDGLAPSPEIWVHGIHAALNDCLYRNMYLYANLAMVDLDEFIVPRRAGDLVELLEYMDDHLTGSHPTGSYNFRNAFFFRQWPDDPTVTDAIELKLHTIAKTQRCPDPNPFNERSKYICKPPLVVETGNHFVWEYVDSGVATVYVEPDLALSQHYRNCSGDLNYYTKVFDYKCAELKVSTTDKTAHRFRDALSRRVVDVWTEQKDMCRIFEFNYVGDSDYD